MALLNQFYELHYLRSGEMSMEKEKRRKYTKRRGNTTPILIFWNRLGHRTTYNSEGL